MSRADVAEMAGLSENSLIRYERAGIDDDGQYPPSPKLAQLCFALDLNPLTVLLSCLSYGDFWNSKTYLWEREFMLQGHPDYAYLESEVYRLQRENAMYKSALRVAYKIEDPDLSKEGRIGLTKKVRTQLENEAALVAELEATGTISTAFGYPLPGIPVDRREEVIQSAQMKLRHPQKKNGPVQNEPSRSIPANQPKEAAPTASQSKPQRRKAKETG
jgi:transcriptional regulator with XRE-family HTH domain